MNTTEQHTNPMAGTIRLPGSALRCIKALEEAGAEVWAVGGFVRDALLGRAAYDVDLAASSPAQQTQEILEAAGIRAIPTGITHGTVTAIADGHCIEITTFRAEGPYSDGRHPDRISYVETIEEDLARRDLTVNAIAYHPERGLRDPFGGLGDLTAGTIRAVGEPGHRFAEDGLRILRCLRFAAQLGFEIENATAEAAHSQSFMLSRIAAERIEAELRKLLCGEHAADVILEHRSILEEVLPELAPMAGLDQRTPYHCYDVLEHTVHALASVPPSPVLRYAALFHDMGKPHCMSIDATGRGHFYGHPAISARMAADIADRLRLPKAETARICRLVTFHDSPLDPTEHSIRRMAANLGGDVSLLRELMDLKRGDAFAHAPQHQGRAATMDETEALLDRMIANGDAVVRRDLAVNGRDIMALGIAEGPEIGMILDALFEDLIEGKVQNSGKELLEAAIRHRL